MKGVFLYPLLEKGNRNMANKKNETAAKLVNISLNGY